MDAFIAFIKEQLKDPVKVVTSDFELKQAFKGVIEFFILYLIVSMRFLS